MRKNNQKPNKAYRNLDFLKSPDARAVRILSEFLEPLSRFRQNGIKDTIVFFGSARTKSSEESRRILNKLKRKSKGSKKIALTLQEQIVSAENQVKMSRYYDDAVELARLLTLWTKKLKASNRFVICSGGGPGIMEAANRGAALAKGRSIGLNISLPFEQEPNKYISEELNFEFHYFFMRKFWFVYLAKALVMFPGGFGTLDETMEVLTLLQTDKIKKQMTVVLYGAEYWKTIIDFNALVKYGVISKTDLNLFKFADTPREAFQYLVRELTKNYPYETSLLPEIEG